MLDTCLRSQRWGRVHPQVLPMGDLNSIFSIAKCRFPKCRTLTFFFFSTGNMLVFLKNTLKSCTRFPPPRNLLWEYHGPTHWAVAFGATLCTQGTQITPPTLNPSFPPLTPHPQCYGWCVSLPSAFSFDEALSALGCLKPLMLLMEVHGLNRRYSWCSRVCAGESWPLRERCWMQSGPPPDGISRTP